MSETTYLKIDREVANDVHNDGGEADGEEEAKELALQDEVDDHRILLYRTHLQVTDRQR